MGIASRFLSQLCLLFVLALVSAPNASAQRRSGIPTLAEADSVLALGIQSFERGRYPEARDQFDSVLKRFRENAATTTAILFAAKSAYRMADYPGTRAYLAGFAGSYPTSSFVDEAALLDELALSASLNEPAAAATVGIVLSLSDEERVVSQEMFNGIRLAVDLHNDTHPKQPIRMVFRDIQGGEAAIRRGVRELSDLDADLIVGTLFSEDAVTAAQEANRRKTVFVAPLATDERVTQNNSFAFQANPSMTVRGAAMARFAVNGLRLDSLAVILAQDDRGISERLSDGFVEEASRLGASIQLVSILPHDDAFLQLADLLPSDTLNTSQAVYIPLASDDPVATAGSVLSNLDRMTRLLFNESGVASRAVRVLGNAAWHDLPQLTHASTYTATYGNDYLIQPSENSYLQFASAFEFLAGHPPGRPGVTGFDVMTFLLGGLTEPVSASLDEHIRKLPAFQGIGMRIHFDGRNVNQALFYHRYRDGRLSLLR